MRELESSIDSREFSEWMAYHLIEPIPDSNYHAALTCSTMVNLWSKTRARPEDFMPGERRTRRQTTEEHLAIFRGIAALQAARDRSKGA